MKSRRKKSGRKQNPDGHNTETKNPDGEKIRKRKNPDKKKF